MSRKASKPRNFNEFLNKKQKNANGEYQQTKIKRMQTLGQNAIKTMLQNNLKSSMMQMYEEEKDQTKDYDKVLSSLEQKRLDEKVKNYQKTMIN